MRDRIQITDIRPLVDGGRFAGKAAVGHPLDVSATVFREGHDLTAAAVRLRHADDREWQDHPMRREGERFHAEVTCDRNGPWVMRIVGWTDHYATWVDGLVKKHRAGIADLSLELEEGALILESHMAPAGVPAPVPARLGEVAELLRDPEVPVHVKVDTARAPDVLDLLTRHPDRRDPTTTDDIPLWVDRARATFSAWYEFFPRSVGSDGTTSGTFATAATRLPAIAAMGFDTVYLPPIHPIGRTHRKGPNNTLNAGPDDPGVPWAIGSEHGGHDAVHPDLGTLDDFDDFVAAAAAVGLEIALDFAIQCSPDHPWVTEHPEWFKHRPDGSIAYAENPPKKYQDIYPIDFDTPDIDGLCAELRRVVLHWVDHGVRVFRVDNPHTKALPFWEWLIDEVHQVDPGVIFLAEAFTRPAMMQQLAKLGFTQSYTYFTWRTSKHELTEYLSEVALTEQADHFRPNFWPNTPDILHEYLQEGTAAGFKTRYALAALTSPNFGIYSGYELLEHVPVRPGSEEYLDSEKYAYRPRDYDVDHSIAPFITRINQIRRERPEVFADIRNIRFHHIGNDQLLCFSKVGRDLRNRVLVIVNLDQHHAQEATTWLDMGALGLQEHDHHEVEDLLTGDRWHWHGPDNYVRLDPHGREPLHVLQVHPPR